MAELPFEYDDYERGLASATKVVELTPDDPEAHQILGRLLVASSDEEAGVESYRRALDLPSNEARAYRELAFDLLELDLFEEASTALERARALEPDDADAAFTLALALSEAGRLDEATSAFEEAAALGPPERRPLALPPRSFSSAQGTPRRRRRFRARSSSSRKRLPSIETSGTRSSRAAAPRKPSPTCARPSKRRHDSACSTISSRRLS